MYFLLLQVIQSDFKFLATELRIFLNETFWSFSSDDFKLNVWSSLHTAHAISKLPLQGSG